ncbi:uncharacterized protein LOC129001201 [Macrosteles quadrilineatus]|uniref:uncharacterized protein LOC129001201 n=1 Tax=Macrosteles quadrilineatus TaxID=74068 RepID=UPI0023E13DE7|nr:uncharacterized protein LOC129001201 [Macrosteles quadrilineatus]
MLQIVSLLFTTVYAAEVGIPERFLRPRHYNPHPLQTLLSGPAPLRLSQVLLDQPPYQLYPRTSTRQDDSSPVQFPEVPATVKPPKKTSSVYGLVPKNYAFAYAVKDRQSGDDFSHKQAHNGQSTKGEYRVKLPDGRTQIVSYTADNSGYKADVRYDEAAKPVSNPQVYYTGRPADSVYYTPRYSGVSNSILQEPDYSDEPEVIYKHPVHVVAKSHSVAAQYAKPSATPRPLEVLFSPTPRPYKSLQPLQLRALPQTAEEYTSSDSPNYYPYVSSTPSPPVSGYYASAVSSTATPIEEEQDDIPRPATKPAPISNFYATSTTPAPHGVRYILVPSHYYDES